MSIFQEFVAGWWGGKSTRQLRLYSFFFLGVSGLIVGHPFDTVKVIMNDFMTSHT